MKDLSIAVLCDVYGEALTEKQMQAIRLYYDNDLSLAEIAEIMNVSRQAVHFTLDAAEDLLKRFERQIGLVDKMSKVYGGLDEIANLLKERKFAEVTDAVETMKQDVRSKYGAFFKFK